MDTHSHPMEMLNIPVEAIDRIEIVRGPNSVIYGNGASFGAINIITDESFYHDQFKVSYGSRNTRRTSLRWSVHDKDSHLIVNAGTHQSNGIGARLNALISETGLQEFPFLGITDPNATLDGRLESESQYLHLSAGWKDLYFDYSYNTTELEFFFAVPPVADGNLRETTNSRATIGWDATLDSDFALDTRFTYGSFDIVQDFDAFTPNFVGDNTLGYDSLELESLLSYVPSDKLNFIAGINWQRMMNLREFTLIPALGLNNEVVEINQRDTQSFFTQASFDLNEKLRFTGGIRIEEHKGYQRDGFTNVLVDTGPTFGQSLKPLEIFTPRASLIYQKSDAEVIKLMGAMPPSSPPS